MHAGSGQGCECAFGESKSPPVRAQTQTSCLVTGFHPLLGIESRPVRFFQPLPVQIRVVFVRGIPIEISDGMPTTSAFDRPQGRFQSIVQPGCGGGNRSLEVRQVIQRALLDRRTDRPLARRTSRCPPLAERSSRAPAQIDLGASRNRLPTRSPHPCALLSWATPLRQPEVNDEVVALVRPFRYQALSLQHDRRLGNGSLDYGEIIRHTRCVAVAVGP